MAINRRQFFQLSGTALALAMSGCSKTESGMLVGGFRTRNNQYGVAAVHPNGHTIWSQHLPGRLHEITANSDQQLLAAFARRPGKFIALLDAGQGQIRGQIDAPDGLVFEGHGLWQESWLWATAAAADGAAYLLGYDLSAGDTADLLPNRAIALPGVGPHQVLALDKSLVVALGGWRSNDRDILNADDFDSALAWVDLETQRTRLLKSPEKALSVRHLATDGLTVWAGLQYPRPHASESALIYQTTGSEWHALQPPAAGWKIFSGYIGSVAHLQGELLATSPQGHYFGRWNLPTGQCIEATSALDVCPAAASGRQWFVGSGTGQVRSTDSGWLPSDFFWDNHWTFLSS